MLCTNMSDQKIQSVDLIEDDEVKYIKHIIEIFKI